MYLFIFESIGTSELILVGIVALIFLGPRKLPELAKKAGKIMSEFRGTANEFKDTWQREVNFEEEIKALDISDIKSEPVARVDSLTSNESGKAPDAPAIKEIDAASFEHLKPVAPVIAEEPPQTVSETPNDKKNWL